MSVKRRACPHRPTSGIGTETARVLALRGAHVILAARSLAKLEATKRELESCEYKYYV